MPWKQLAPLAVIILVGDSLDVLTKQRYHELFARAEKDQSNGTVALDDEAKQLLGARLLQEDLVWPVPWSPTIV